MVAFIKNVWYNAKCEAALSQNNKRTQRKKTYDM